MTAPSERQHVAKKNAASGNASHGSREIKRLSRLAEHRRELGRAWRRLLEAPAATLVTVLVIAIALLLPTLLFSLQRALSGGLAELQSDAAVNVYLDMGASKEDAYEISKQLLTFAGVDTVETISPSQALEQLSARTGLDGATLLSDFESASPAEDSPGGNPLPYTLVVGIDRELGRSEQADSLGALASQLAERIAALEGVESVSVEGDWLRRLDALSDVVDRAAQLLGLLVCIGLLTTVGNSVRLAVEQRRDEIRVAKLIGATDGYIARPFLYTGLILGAAGGLLASLLQLAIVGLVALEAAQFLALYTPEPAQPGGLAAEAPAALARLSAARLAFDGAVLILAGGLIGWTAAALSSRRAIRANGP